MQYTTLGRTGLKVSRLCLGTMNFGPETSETDSHAIMDKALEVGINFFDTADVYGWKKGEGWTEQIIGRWLAKGGRRDQIVLATKCYNVMGDGPNDRGLSASHIRAACDASLKRMGTDRIDLFQMHHIERHTPWDEIWQAMELLVQQGKILYVGSSNFAGWHIVKANEAAARRNFLGLVSEQCKYSLACRAVEAEILPACRDYGVGVIPWSPLDGGLLGGVLSEGNRRRRSGEQMRQRIERIRPQLERWESFCAARGQAPADVAIAWLLTHKAMTAPIIGPRTIEHLTGSLRVLDVQLDEAALKQLNEIWPGPGAEAPEFFAW